MVDLHCHILPCLDDGAQTLEEAVEMARIAVADGITDIVATPHTDDGIYKNYAQNILRSVESFQKTLDDRGIDLRIHPGNEVHVTTDVIENLIRFETVTIGNKQKYLLLELPVQSIPTFTEELLYEIQVEGITPILAHPERNVVLRENPRLLAKWVEEGTLAQITAGSLLGLMGERARVAAELMVKHRLVHVLASDAHNVGRRRPELQMAYQKLTGLTSEQEESYFRTNSEAILLGEKVVFREPTLPKEKKRKWFFFRN